MSEPVVNKDEIVNNTSPSKVDNDTATEDASVYQRTQQDKWTRARKGDTSKRGSKRFKQEAQERRQRDYNDATEYKPRLDENGNPIPKSPRRPKKKVACMIGYCGTGYNGMQIQNNPNIETIEGDLFKAFVAAGAISPENADDLKKNGFMRAARTDKGVHAAGNVISCKLIIEDEDIIEKINAQLPDQIRVWGIERTNKSFDCRKMCSSRVYEYLLPTYSLLPPKPRSVLSELLRKEKEAYPEIMRKDEEGEKWWEETLQAVYDSGISPDDLAKAQTILESSGASGSNKAEEEGKEKTKLYDDDGNITEAGKLIKSIKLVENKRRRAYNISTERLNTFREALNQYEGAHNFHNFTLGKTFKDPSSVRYMKKLTVSDPFVIEGTEWVSIKIHGQSFMLHQIRKMIAMAALVIRTGCPLERISDCFGPIKVNIPKAPALGLLLENPVYDGYNTTLEKHGYNAIDFSKYQEEMDKFKMKYIYDKIYAEEVKENTFYGFFGFVDSFKGTSDAKEGRHVFDFLGAKFDSAALKKHEKVEEAVEAAEATEPAQPFQPSQTEPPESDAVSNTEEKDNDLSTTKD